MIDPHNPGNCDSAIVLLGFGGWVGEFKPVTQRALSSSTPLPTNTFLPLRPFHSRHQNTFLAKASPNLPQQLPKYQPTASTRSEFKLTTSIKPLPAIMAFTASDICKVYTHRDPPHDLGQATNAVFRSSSPSSFLRSVSSLNVDATPTSSSTSF